MIVQTVVVVILFSFYFLNTLRSDDNNIYDKKPLTLSLNEQFFFLKKHLFKCLWALEPGVGGGLGERGGSSLIKKTEVLLKIPPTKRHQNPVGVAGVAWNFLIPKSSQF